MIVPEEGEIFVDGGAYTGDTIQQFIDTAKKNKVKFKKVIAFEPDKQNFELLKKFYGQRENILLFQMGLSDADKRLFFQENGAASRLVDDESRSTVKIHVIDIDSVPECQDATWIKMDIEGAEMQALYGAQSVIRRNHPKLTICIYHSDEDMICIAEYIHELVPEYRLYVRHHSKSNLETVLYALP